MPAPQIVKPFDVIEHIGPGVIARAILRSIRPFSLQRREEALHCGIIPAITLPARAARNALVDQQALEGLAPVLAALV
jgi:hypothetical protein